MIERGKKAMFFLSGDRPLTTSRVVSVHVDQSKTADPVRPSQIFTEFLEGRGFGPAAGFYPKARSVTNSAGSATSRAAEFPRDLPQARSTQQDL